MAELEPKPENFVEFVYDLIAATYNKKKPLKQMDLQRDLPKKYAVQKKEVQMAVKDLVDAGRVVYTYFGGSYLELPHVEGSAKKM
jgi:hypothetical protein